MGTPRRRIRARGLPVVRRQLVDHGREVAVDAGEDVGELRKNMAKLGGFATTEEELVCEPSKPLQSTP